MHERLFFADCKWRRLSELTEPVGEQVTFGGVGHSPIMANYNMQLIVIKFI